jgi:hypothetical protein
MLMLDQSKQQLKSIMHTEFVAIDPSTGKRAQHKDDFMEFLKDKVVPSESPFHYASRREFWLNELKAAAIGR